ncbi:MAG: flavin-dependent oxidoreductase [Pseudomonadales bacterium]|nr:flavin-dependent oxidoreductase [Pseudomonadales bacterium]
MNNKLMINNDDILPVVIAGGGIAGLTMALTLHQLGIPARIYEAVGTIAPLGVGINLQPNAVRELLEMGISESLLNTVGIQTREWALVGRNGNDIYAEARGLDAGYLWPQYSVHRGQLQMLLYRLVEKLLAPGTLVTGTRVTAYENIPSQNCVRVTTQAKDGTTRTVLTRILIGADGLHSCVRAQMYPQQPPVQWGGAIMWRGTSQAKPIRTGASFVGLGGSGQRLVFYPISAADNHTGLATINWIAEITVNNSSGWREGDWNRQVKLADIVPYFADWQYDWLDVPALLEGAESIYEYPMIDRDPVDTWIDGRVALIGDAAHVMYPVGSNGASQAIVDARILGAAILANGLTEGALSTYDQLLCAEVSQLVLRNRGAGPFGILSLVEERCGGIFNNIDEVIPRAEMTDFMAGYKAAAGFAIETLNQAPSTLALPPIEGIF